MIGLKTRCSYPIAEYERPCINFWRGFAWLEVSLDTENSRNAAEALLGKGSKEPGRPALLRLLENPSVSPSKQFSKPKCVESNRKPARLGRERKENTQRCRE